MDHTQGTPTSPDPAAREDARPRPLQWALLVFLGLALLTFGLDVTILNSSIPAAAVALDAATRELQWFAGAYTLALAAALPLAGTVGDQGRSKAVLVMSLAVFTVSNITVLAVTEPWHLIAVRALQGLSSAFVLALSLTLIAQRFRGPHRLKALSIAALTSTIGIPLGPFIGGVITSTLDFRWVFMANVPLAVIAIAGILALAPPDRPTGRVRIGVFPFLLGTGLVALTWGAIEAGHLPSVSSFAAILIGGSVAALCLAFAGQGRARALPRDVLCLRSFRLGAVATFVTSVVMISAVFLVPQHLSFQWNWGPLEIAWGLTPVIISLVIGTRFAAPAVARFGQRWAFFCGFLLTFLGCVLYLTMPDQVSWTALVAWSVPFGFGLGLVLPLAMDLSLSEIEDTHYGAASAAVQAARQVGGTLGVAVFGSLMNVASHLLPGAMPYRTAFLGMGVVALLAATWWLRSRSPHHPNTDDPS